MTNSLLLLAHHRGLVAGKRYAEALLQPANTTPEPKCPYWRPCYRHYWMLGFSSAVFERIYCD